MASLVAYRGGQHSRVVTGVKSCHEVSRPKSHGDKGSRQLFVSDGSLRQRSSATASIRSDGLKLSYSKFSFVQFTEVNEGEVEKQKKKKAQEDC